jgi:hypothetical protein
MEPGAVAVRNRRKGRISINSAHLIPGTSGNLLLGPVSTRATINEIDADFQHLPDKDLGLFYAPLPPFPARVAFWTLSPVSRADANEKGPVGPCGTATGDDAERESHTIFKRLTAVRVCTCVRKRGQPRMHQVSVCTMYLYIVDWERQGLKNSDTRDLFVCAGELTSSDFGALHCSDKRVFYLFHVFFGHGFGNGVIF